MGDALKLLLQIVTLKGASSLEIPNEAIVSMYVSPDLCLNFRYDGLVGSYSSFQLFRLFLSTFGARLTRIVMLRLVSFSSMTKRAESRTDFSQWRSWER